MRIAGLCALSLFCGACTTKSPPCDPSCMAAKMVDAGCAAQSPTIVQSMQAELEAFDLAQHLCAFAGRQAVEVLHRRSAVFNLETMTVHLAPSIPECGIH